MKLKVVLIFLGGLATQSTALADLGSAEADALGNSCSGCHSPDNTSIPKLEALTSIEIESAMLGFRAGTREATVMQRIAKGYSPEEIKQLAESIANPNSKK